MVLKKLGFWILGFVWAFVAQAQGLTYVSPAKAIEGFSAYVEIKTTVDLRQLSANLSRFQSIERLRVDGPLDIAQVAAVAGRLDNLEELHLESFSGILQDEDLQELEWIPRVILHVADGMEEALLLNDRWSQLQAVRLILEVVPDDYTFLQSWTSCRELFVLAPFSAADAQLLCQSVAQSMSNLQRFGLSLDNAVQLPDALKTLPRLKELQIVDNASWMEAGRLEDLGSLEYRFGFPAYPQNRPIKVVYRALDPRLTEREEAFLTAYFPAPPEAASKLYWEEEMLVFDFVENVELKPLSTQNRMGQFIERPLFPDVQDAQQTWVAQADQDGLFMTRSEAVVLVPARALALADGTEWTGEYVLRLNWYNSPTLAMTAGVNLQLDSAGRSFGLSPSVLFDVQAFAQVTPGAAYQPLVLKDGYFIKIMALGAATAQSRFYAWNAERNRWLNGYDYDYEFSDDWFAGTDFYQFYAGRGTAKRYSSRSVFNLDERFESLGFNGLLDPGESRVVLEPYSSLFVCKEAQSGSKETYTLRRGKSVIGVRRFPEMEPLEKHQFAFQVYDRSEALFPELKTLAKTPLVLRSVLDAKTILNGFFRSQDWIDFRIRESAGKYFAEFRSSDHAYSIELLQPKIQFRDDPAKAKREQGQFERAMANYLAARKTRDNVFASWIQQGQESEWQQSRYEILDPSSGNRQQQRIDMRLRSFGRFCWAAPTELSSPLELSLRLAETGSVPLEAETLVLLYSNPPFCQTIQSSGEFRLQMDAKRLQAMACRDATGRCFLLSGSDFRSLNTKTLSTLYLPMNEVPPSALNEAAINKLLGIKKRP
ncbi:MAG: hypothetical protein RL577_234 [Bacteroidota bacterium]